MKTFTEFNKSNVKDVRAEINKALAILAAVGINASIGTITFDSSEVRTKLTCRVTKPGSSSNSISEIGVAKIMQPDISFFTANKGKTVRVSGVNYTLDDFKARNFKKPFIVGNYKLSREQVERFLIK